MEFCKIRRLTPEEARGNCQLAVSYRPSVKYPSLQAPAFRDWQQKAGVSNEDGILAYTDADGLELRRVCFSEKEFLDHMRSRLVGGSLLNLELGEGRLPSHCLFGPKGDVTFLRQTPVPSSYDTSEILDLLSKQKPESLTPGDREVERQLKVLDSISRQRPLPSVGITLPSEVCQYDLPRFPAGSIPLKLRDKYIRSLTALEGVFRDAPSLNPQTSPQQWRFVEMISELRADNERALREEETRNPASRWTPF